jgi:hypothetical protein
MNRTRTTSRSRAAGFAAAAGLALAAVTPPAHAQSTHEQELEKRVGELERLVKQLLEQQRQGTAAPAAAAATAPASAVPAPGAATAPAAAPSGPPVQQASILPNAVAGTKFFYDGYVKADVLWTDAKDGQIPEQTSGRDFYVPSATPIGGFSKGTNMDAHVKQTRLILGTDTPLGGKDVLSTRVEFDLFGTSLGDQRATNTYGLQLRHAYLQWREWLVGQTWSNFQDVVALPDAVDFIGSTDGTVFVRQPQVRFTRGGLSLSAENRQTTLTPYLSRATPTSAASAAQNARVTSDDGNVPDLTAKYTWKGNWGQLSAALLARQLKYRAISAAGVSTVDDTRYTGAGSLSGKIMVGRDDLRFVLLGGTLGRYVGLNFANDAVITTDGVTGTGRLDTIRGYAGFVAYRHVWTDALRSSLYYARQSYDNDVQYAGPLANKSSESWTVNLIYTPLPKLDIGGEFRHATRELEGGKSGSLDRVQFTTKYSF